MEFIDQELTCKLCGETFIWEGGEQAFFQSKGLLPPRHCKACRKLRRDSITNPPPRKGEEQA